MKKQVGGILFTLFYLAALFKPLLPHVVYYANYDYIVKELCENKDKPESQCNGRCYLNALKKRIAPPIEKKPVSTVPISTNDLPIFPIDLCTYKILMYEDSKKLNTPIYFKHFVITKYSFSIFHPPKVFV